MTDESPRFRPLTAADAEPAAALIRAAFAAITPPPDPLPSALRVTADDITRHLATGAGHVAEAETLAGAVLWHEQDGGLYISRLSVAPAWQRRGIARTLLNAAIEEARRTGQPRIHLGVRLALTGNRALFASLGFRETRQHTHEGYHAPTWVQMERLTC